MTAHELEVELAQHEAAGLYEVGPGPIRDAVRAALSALAGETEDELAHELNPVRRWYPDAMLEHLAHEAAEAESEAEAGEAFLPLIPLVAAKLLPLAAKAAPLIAKALPKVMNVVSRVTPHLTRSVTNMARTMFRGADTRRLLRTLPTIAQRTVGQIARQVAAGRPVTAQTAVRTLARQAATVLRQPSQVRRAVVRSRVLDRRLHRAVPTRPGVAYTGGTAGGCPPGCRPAGNGATATYIPAAATYAPRARGCGCRCSHCGR